MRNSVSKTIAAGALLVMAGAADAFTRNAGFQVSATVTTNCSINAADMNFGNFDGSLDLTATSSITVACTAGTGYDVDLSTGSGSFAMRTMSQGGPEVVNYNLYTDVSHTTVWGDATGSTAVVSGIGSGIGTPDTLTVYGQLLVSDNLAGVTAGTYTDLITATVTY